jgi:hypothetical protein
MGLAKAVAADDEKPATNCGGQRAANPRKLQ